MAGDALRAAAEALVKRLEYVHSDGHYMAVWATAQTHRGPYRGPTYTAELDTLRSLLAATEYAPAKCPECGGCGRTPGEWSPTQEPCDSCSGTGRSPSSGGGAP